MSSRSNILKIVRTCRCAKSFCAFCLRNLSFCGLARDHGGCGGTWGDVGDVWHHRDEVVRVSIREAPLLRVRTCLPHFT